MKSAKYTLTAVIAVVAFSAPQAARADDVTVTADLTFDTCAAASGCQENFDISYEWNNTTNTLAAPDAVITATGDLGTNFFANAATDPSLVPLNSPANIVLYTATDPLGDSLFLTLSETGSSLAPGTYTETNTINGSEQFLSGLGCGTGDGPICDSGEISPAMAEVTVSPLVPTPEPPAFVLLGSGLVALIGLGFYTKRVA